MKILGGVLGAMLAFGAVAAEFPKPVEGDWVAKDFRFHDGSVLPEVSLH